MRQFDVLDAEEELGDFLFLEASAGSGKTFSIVHLVLRLLIERGVRASEIIAVTFTRKAALQLKTRITQELNQCLDLILDSTKRRGEKVPLYVRKAFEKDPDVVIERLTRASEEVDFLEVSTVHAFAARREGRLCLFENEAELGVDEKALFEKMWSILKKAPDFIQELMKSLLILRGVGSGLCLEQENALRLSLKGYRELVQDCVFFVSTDLPMKAPQISPQNTSDKLYQFWTHIFSIKKEVIQGIPVLLSECAPCFSGLCSRDGVIKEPHRERIEEIEEVLKIESGGGSKRENILLLFSNLYRLQFAFSDANLKKQYREKRPPNLSNLLALLHDLFDQNRAEIEGWDLFLELVSWIKEELDPFIQKSADRSILDYTLKSLARKMKQGQVLSFFNHPPKALIVDEFQDTDPWQWEIFKTVAEEIKPFFAVVGDPKQAIYSFRQADIYTYLDAKKWFMDQSPKSVRGLDKNFRARADLVHHLNNFFGCADEEDLDVFSSALELGGDLHRDDQTASNALRLRIEKAIAHNSKTDPQEDASDSLSFWLYRRKDKKWLDHAMVSFASRWNQRASEDTFAVLVADHRQGAEVAAALDRLKIPCLRTRPKSIKNSPLGPFLYYLLEGVSRWPVASGVRFALSSLLFGWDTLSLEQSFEGKGDENAKTHNATWHHLAFLLAEKGLGAFWGELDSLKMAKVSSSSQPVSIEQRLQTLDASLLTDYHSWRALLLKWWSEKPCVESLLRRFLAFLHSGEDVGQQAPHEEAVTILTVHASKGLEFSHVLNVAVNCTPRRRPFTGSFEGKGYVGFFDHLVKMRESNTNTLIPMTSLSSRDLEVLIQDRESERFRLLYVSMTRAKKQQIVVWSCLEDESSSKSIKPDQALDIYRSARSNSESTLIDLWALFWAWKTDRGSACKEGYLALERFGRKKNLGELIRQKKASWAWVVEPGILQEETQSVADSRESSLHRLVLPKIYDKSSRSKKLPNTSLTSFSKWAQTEEAGQTPVTAIGSSLHTITTEPVRVMDLPRGTLFGQLMHYALEKWWAIRRKSTCQSDLAEAKNLYHQWALRFCERSVLLKSYKEAFVEMLDRTLSLDLQEALALQELPVEDVIVEGRFLMNPSKTKGEIGEEKASESCFQGYIDLCFLVGKKLYFVDYKSNHLGDELADYCEERLLESFYGHHYDMQAAIYARAIEQYAQRMDSDITLAGGFYLYTRAGKYLFFSRDQLESFHGW